MEGLVGKLNFCSLNVRGIRNEKKRRNIFNKIKKSNNDIIAIQEAHFTDDDKHIIDREWGENYHFSEGTNRSKGLITLFNRNIKKEMTEISGKNDRMITSKIKVGESSIYVVNVYGPCEDNDKLKFVDNIKKEIKRINDDSNIVLLGDFNIVMSNEYDIVAGLPHNEKIVKSFRETIQELGLCDVWRIKNPGKKAFSWSNRNPFIARRLDYVFVSESILNFCNKTKMEEFGFTDHKKVEVESDFNKIERGPGYYKFNTNLLRDTECVNEIRSEIKRADELDVNPHLKLEYIKIKIKSAGISHGKKQTRQKKEEKYQIKTKLRIIEDRIENDLYDTNDIVEYNNLKQRLEIIEMVELEGARMRAGQKWIEEGEKCNKYFLNLEKQHAADNTINSLYDKDKKREIKNGDQILNFLKKHFENIYKSKDDICNNGEMFYKKGINDQFLDEKDVENLNRDITETEILNALKKCNNKSSPGIDGIPAEVYKFFWHDLKNTILENFKYTFETSIMGISQRQGIICLIHKGKELSRDNISNWRPLTLSNFDYKLLAKVLAIRLGEHIDKCVSKDQTAFIKGRNISNMLRSIEDIIEISKKKEIENIILSIDYEKAFDTLAKTAILKAIEYFGLGKKFKRWIKILLTDRQSCVKNSGFISEDFGMERGVRQGCPISPLLFLITTELLSINIRKDNKIKGCRIGRTSTKIKQFADDTTLFLADLIDFREVLSKIKEFSIFSGLKLNKNKSFALQIGKINKKILSFEGIKFDHSLKILGITFSNEKRAQDIDENIEGKIEKLIRVCRVWSKRKLSMLGKVLILKTFGLSIFTYVIRSIGIKEYHLDIIEKIMFRFLWKNNFSNTKANERVKRIETFKKVDEGGLNMINIREYQNGFYLEWAEKLLNGEEESWKIAPEYFYKRLGGGLVLYSNLSEAEFKGLDLVESPFWRKVLSTWLKYRHKINMNDAESGIQTYKMNMNTPLFNNKDIRYKGNPILLTSCISKNITTVGDVIDFEKKGIISFQDYQEIHGKGIRDIFDYNIIYNALMNQINEIDCTDDGNDIMFGKETLGNLGRKKIMKCINEMKTKNENQTSKWEKKYQMQKWDKRYWEMLRQSTKETRLQVMQWKINHNIYPTALMLEKMKIKGDNRCVKCGQVETIEHFFVECEELKSFWLYVCEYIGYKYETKANMTEREIVLGVIQKESLSQQKRNVMNHILLVAKYTIAKVKYGNGANYKLNFDWEIKKRNL